MAKKITLKDKEGTVLCPHTAIEQVEGLQRALDGKLGKTEDVASASRLTPLTLDHADTTSNAGLTVYQLWTGDEGTDILPNGSMMLNMATNDGVKKQLLFGHPVGSNNNMVIQYRRRAGSWSDWKTIAFTDSTVASVIDGAISTSKIATAAITPAKIQTSIALNGTPSMTVEPTTSSPDKTIASVGLVKEVVDSVEIGVKNLILNSDTDISSSANFIGNISLSENLVVGDMYTITLWATLGSDRTHFSVYPEWGMGGALSNLTQVSDGVFRATFVYAKGDATNANKVGLYQLPSTGTTTSIIDRMKIEKGNKATDWTPAPEDVEAKIEAAKPTIFLQALQPSATEVKDGDIWIIQ